MQVDKQSPLHIEKLKSAMSYILPEPTGRKALDMDFVERLLGRKQDGKLSRATSIRLKRICSDILPCLHPRITFNTAPIKSTDNGLVTLANGIQFKSRKMARTVAGASRLVCFVATVGPEIDRRIENLMQHRRMADAYVADTVGSGAIEHLADRFHKGLAEKIKNSGHSVGLRFSPGYCDWDVTEQEKLFSLLDNDAIGVDLGNTFLMSPRKSISAVFPVFDGMDAVRKNTHHNPCRSCWKKDCIARRVDADTPSH